MLKPSAAPSVNQSSIRSATCSGVPAKTKWPRAPASYASNCRSVGFSRRTRPRITSVRLRAASTEAVGGKSSGVSGRSSGRCEKSCPPNRPDSRLRPTSGSDSSLISRARRLRLGLGRGDHRAEARQDQHLLGRAALGRHQRLQVGVERLRRRLLHMRGEHRLGVPRREAAAGVGRAGLHQHRPALRRARQVQRPGHLVVLALVVDRPDAVRLRRSARRRGRRAPRPRPSCPTAP